MVPILHPMVEVISDVCADIIQFGLVTDDAVMEISLPDGFIFGFAEVVDAFGDDGFVLTNDGTDGAWFWTVRLRRR